MTDAGAAGVSVNLDVLGAGAYDDLADLLEKGRPVHLGIVPSTGAGDLTDRAVVERVLRLLDMLGLDPESAGDLVLTPDCGLAGAGRGHGGPDEAVRTLRLLQRVAVSLRG